MVILDQGVICQCLKASSPKSNLKTSVLGWQSLTEESEAGHWQPLALSSLSAAVILWRLWGPLRLVWLLGPRMTGAAGSASVDPSPVISLRALVSGWTMKQSLKEHRSIAKCSVCSVFYKPVSNTVFCFCQTSVMENWKRNCCFAESKPSENKLKCSD